MKKLLTLGINSYLSNQEYHADKEYLSSSKLKTLLKSAKTFKEELDNPPPPMEGAHLDIGSYAHSLLLEPDLVLEEYAVFPGFRRAGKEFERFKLENSDKKIISMSMENTGRRLADSVKGNIMALKLLEEGESEVSIATRLHDVSVKCRFDRVKRSPIAYVDIKTTREPSGKEYFKQTIKDFEYDLSAALYTDIGNEYYNVEADFYWIVLSKSDLECRVYKASARTMAEGRSKVTKALEKYKMCMQTGIWLDSEEQSAKLNIQHEFEEI